MNLIISSILIIIVGVMIKLPYLWKYRDALNLDEATVGVMALDIMNGHFPVFFYGQKYFGPFESLLAASLFLMVPANGLTLRISMLIAAVATAVICAMAAKTLSGKNAALFTLMWLIIPVPFLNIWAVLPSGGHIGGLLLAALVIYHAAIILAENNDSRWQYFTFGLLCGFSLWMSIGTILYTAGAALVISASKGKRLAGLKIPLALGGVALGCAPLWLNALKDREVKTFVGPGVVNADIRRFFSRMPESLDHVKVLMGLDLLPQAIFYATVVAIILAPLTYWLYMCLNERFRGSRAFLLSIFGWLLVIENFIAYRFINEQGWPQPHYRYYFPFLVGFGLISAVVYEELYKRIKTLAITMFALFLALNLLTNMITWRKGDYAGVMDMKLQAHFYAYPPIISALEKLGVNTAFVPFYYDAPIVFDTMGKVIASAHNHTRFRHYSLSVEASQNPAYVFKIDNSFNFANAIAAAGSSYKQVRAGEFDIFYDLSRKGLAFTPLKSDSITATASSSGKDAALTLDGDNYTSWTGSAEPRDTEYLQYDFGADTGLSRVDIILDENTDMRSRLTLLSSPDGVNWREVVFSPRVAFYWEGPVFVFDTEKGVTQFIFKPIKTRYLRVMNTVISGWPVKIREVNFFQQPDDGVALEEPDWRSVTRFLKSVGVKRIVSGFHFAANVIHASDETVIAPVRTNSLNADFRDKDNYASEEIQAIAVYNTDLDNVIRFLREQNWSFKTQTFGGYMVFYDFNSKLRALAKLAHAKTQSGKQLVIDLNTAANVSAIRIKEGATPIQIFTSMDGYKWNPVSGASKSFNKIHWTGLYPIGSSEEGLVYYFEPCMANHVRITATAKTGDLTIDVMGIWEKG